MGCSVHRLRVNLAGGIETRLEGGIDYIEWGLNVAPAGEPLNCASESNRGVKCFPVGDVSEDP